MNSHLEDTIIVKNKSESIYFVIAKFSDQTWDDTIKRLSNHLHEAVNATVPQE